jgi:hypothetical protein
VMRLSRPLRTVLYSFGGEIVTLAPTSLTLRVTNGNWWALRAMLGEAVTVSFVLSPKTLFVQPDVAPAAVALSDLKPGDAVWIRVRAVRDATLSELSHTALNEVQG